MKRGAYGHWERSAVASVPSATLEAAANEQKQRCTHRDKKPEPRDATFSSESAQAAPWWLLGPA